MSPQLTASIEWLPQDRHLAYMHVDVSLGNLLGWLTERNGQYLLPTRVRTYLDNLVGPESRDLRSSYRLVISATSDDEAIQQFRSLCERLCKGAAAAQEIWGLPSFVFHRFEKGTVEEVVAVISKDDGFHVQTLRRKG